MPVGFNPHPRTGGDIRASGFDPEILVSIHTPARGVTVRLVRMRFGQNCFNPHPRTGGDSHRSYIVHLPSLVSIHTPARGVT